MPKDQEGFGNYPDILEGLMINPYPRSRVVAVKKKKVAAAKDKGKKKKANEQQFEKRELKYPTKDDKGRVKVSE